MSKVYVDKLMAHGWYMYGTYVWSCHMFVDPDTDIEVLHEFAKKIGLKRKWFQNKKSLPHYDLVESKRKKAVDLGAEEVSYKQTAEIIKLYRDRSKESEDAR